MSSDGNCMGIKRPSLFFVIFDFIIFIVLIIGLLQIAYSADNNKAAKQKNGRNRFGSLDEEKKSKDKDKFSDSSMKLDSIVDNTLMDMITNNINGEGALQDMESMPDNTDFSNIGGGDSPFQHSRKRGESELSQQQMNRILFTFQSDNNFFEMKRPRIQSEINLHRFDEVRNNGIIRTNSSMKKQRRPTYSFHSNRTKISIAHSANSDAIINDDSVYGISQERRRKLTMVLFGSPIIEDDNDQSQKSFKLDSGQQSPYDEIRISDEDVAVGRSSIIKCKTLR
ncbi:UNKNOWN [Stylonychia lemnae]|uniref:Uncharacterized protein n=1 Tax=Stylonychia lemnae TaxID=5949 RepID=A0A078AFU3_STYLE|nr:UNKNOWN [Stylonychia lemnae]|eukprot:CDW81140.1 UNKNOWN [Stylonychia lemnae]